MAQPKNADKANLALLQNYLQQYTDQQKLLEHWKNSNKHQLAICFTFPPEFTINLGQVKQSTGFGERVMRFCESVNQPDTIKADIWTRTPNGGTLAGVQPGVAVLGTPIPPEEFLAELKFVLVAFVVPGELVTPHKVIDEAPLGAATKPIVVAKKKTAKMALIEELLDGATEEF